MMPQLQSAYRRHHSTETALLKVLSDVYAAIDCQQATLLGLLDLSEAFDCVDYDILLRRLHLKFGICGTALEWISFLLGRSQQVYYQGRLSVKLQLLFGVPQGSVLGPLLFCIQPSSMLSPSVGAQATRMPTTHKCTSAHQPPTIPMRLIV